MIEFKEGQEKIYVGKHKLTKSNITGWVDLHIIYTPKFNIIDGETIFESKYSGYCNKEYKPNFKKWVITPTKFVRVITVKNIYDIDIYKNLIVGDNHEEEFDILYWDSSGYEYDKKTF